MVKIGRRRLLFGQAARFQLRSTRVSKKESGSFRVYFRIGNSKGFDLLHLEAFRFAAFRFRVSRVLGVKYVVSGFRLFEIFFLVF